jgi:hypothetical protein
LLLVLLPPSRADSRRGSSSRLESPEERQQRAKRLQTQCLNELSLKQLKAWIEEDEEKKTNKVRLHSAACVRVRAFLVRL